MLKSLEINGFKSFGKKAELSFTSQISGVVGPNGSGKSNVAEAFRFVLGEQSMKSMRGKKGEDLIYNGGSGGSRLNRANVRLTFDNSRKLFQIDFPEVTIERVVHRDGVNEYFINGSSVRLKDVAELLAQARIGASGHHIISQGEADRILSASTKERREMVEDALGLKVYQYKKEESERKLAKTEENMKQVESQRRELAPHLKFLKKQVERIHEARSLKEELCKELVAYLARERVYLAHSRTNLETEESFAKTRSAELEARLSQAQSLIAVSNGKDALSEALSSAQQKVRDARSHISQVQVELGRIQGEIKSVKRLKERQEQELAKDVPIPLSRVKRSVVLMSERQRELLRSESLDDLRRGVTELVEEVSRIVEEYSSHATPQATAELISEIAKLETCEVDLVAKISELEKVLSEAEGQYQKVTLEIEADKDSKRDAEKEMITLTSLQREAAQAQSALAARKGMLLEEEASFKREVEEGRVLVGRQVYEYETLVLSDEAGVPVPLETIATEDRRVQIERRRQVERKKLKIEDMGAGGGVEVEREYKETSERDEFLTKELTDLRVAKESLETLIADLEEKLTGAFKEGLGKINEQFGAFFKLMFGGGEGKLAVSREERRARPVYDLNGDEVVDAEAPVEVFEGVEIEVSLPRKKIKGLHMLSGGERALTSIALLFAISQVNPPPFIILDETDAALDEANSRKYGDMIESLAKYSQLIVITHNRETMSRAGIIYGVTMSQEGHSRLLSISFDQGSIFAK